MTPPRRPLVFLAFLFAVSTGLAAEQSAPADKSSPADKPAKKHYLYVLKLIPRLYQDTAWTKADEETVGRHFRHLQAAVERGQVVLAGKTDEPGDVTFGLVIFEAADDSAAREFMESDPAVAGGVMTAELHPYMLALLRKG